MTLYEAPSTSVSAYLLAVVEDLSRGLAGLYPNLTIRLQMDRTQRIDRPMIDVRAAAGDPTDDIEGMLDCQAVIMWGHPDDWRSQSRAGLAPAPYVDGAFPGHGEQSVSGIDLAWRVMSRLRLHRPLRAKNISLDAAAVDPQAGYADYVVQWSSPILLDQQWDSPDVGDLVQVPLATWLQSTDAVIAGVAYAPPNDDMTVSVAAAYNYLTRLPDWRANQDSRVVYRRALHLRPDDATSPELPAYLYRARFTTRDLDSQGQVTGNEEFSAVLGGDDTTYAFWRWLGEDSGYEYWLSPELSTLFAGDVPPQRLDHVAAEVSHLHPSNQEAAS